MRHKILIIAIACLTLPGVVWGYEVNRQFEVGAGGELRLNARQADIRVELREGSLLALRCRELDESDLEIRQSGNLIEVQQKGGRFGWRDATFELIVPVRFNLDLRTGGGDVRIDGGLEGMLLVNTHGGDVEFGDVRGETDVRSSGGDIEGGEIAGNAKVRTHGGDVTLGSIGGTAEISSHGGDIELGRIGNRLQAKTYGGDVLVGDVDAEAELVTLGGDIEVGRVSASALLDTKGGDILLRGASGNVTARSAGGDLELLDVTGSIDAETAGGDIYAFLSPGGSAGSRLVSKGGDIELSLGSGAGVTVRATIRIRGSWGSRSEQYVIESDFPADSHEKDAVTREIRGVYTVNGGGPVVEVETVNGDIRIRRR